MKIRRIEIFSFSPASYKFSESEREKMRRCHNNHNSFVFLFNARESDSTFVRFGSKVFKFRHFETKIKTITVAQKRVQRGEKSLILVR